MSALVDVCQVVVTAALLVGLAVGFLAARWHYIRVIRWMLRRAGR